MILEGTLIQKINKRRRPNMVQKVGLVIPEAAQAMIDAGELVRTDGILRKAETMEIFKHLDIVDLEDLSAMEELASALKRVVNEKKTVVAIVVCAAISICVGVGFAIHENKKKHKELEEKCNAFLNKAIKTYFDAAKQGNLDINTVEYCENALVSLPSITEKVFISMTKEQIISFTNCLTEYTLQLAKDNEYEIEDEKALEYKGNVVSFMISTLRVQKDILQKCA